MNVIKLTILLLSVSECLANVIEVKSKKINESESLVEATVEILSSCYGKKVNTVGFSGISHDILFETLDSKESLSVVLIGNDTSDVPVDRKLQHKLQIFIVTAASSSTKLNHTLGQIKRSRWWNHMATFIIIDWRFTTDHGCSNAFQFLLTAWYRNLLNALYLCYHETKGRLIYSFNPYTSKAPDPWQFEKTLRAKNNHPWTLLRREYDPNDKRICVNIDFDKTSDLGGYEIYSSVKEVPDGMIIDKSITGPNRFDGYFGLLVAAFFKSLNATPHLLIYDNKIPGLNDKMGNDITMDTVNGISDIMLIPRIYDAVLNYTVSRLYRQSSLGIITQFTGPQSQLDKLISVLDRSSRLGVGLVALTTVFFLKFFLRQPIGSAVINVCRIATNSSLTSIPNNQAARLYLAGVFFLVVTIVGIYQGKLASLLTKSKGLPNVETIRDLAVRNYTIHGHKTYAHIFSDPVFKDRFIKHQFYDCVEYVVRDHSAACVDQRLNLIVAAAKFKLHVSRDPAMKAYSVFVIREDWPLEKRFNTILGALTESHVGELIRMKQSARALSIAKFYESEDEIEKFEVMVLNELIFAFIILGFGLAFATVCFVFEVAVSRIAAWIYKK